MSVSTTQAGLIRSVVDDVVRIANRHDGILSKITVNLHREREGTMVTGFATMKVHIMSSATDIQHDGSNGEVTIAR